MEGYSALLRRQVAELMKPKPPKLEPVSESMASIKGDSVVQQLKMPKVEPGCKGDSVQKMPKLEPGCKGDSAAQQLKMSKSEPQRENNNSPKCVLGPNLINLSSSSASSSSEDEEDNESGGEDSEAASSDHADRSDSDVEEYKVASDEDSDEGEYEEGRPSWGKKPKTSSEGEGEVKSEDELLEKPVKKKSRVKITPKRADWGDHPKHKQRNSNPGRRRVGGRIYDSVLGRTCHWCRQKTVELHVECTLCPIRFCGPCLQNRNGENADLESLVRWICPKCRGGCGPGCKNCCNCGPCRKSQGFGPTGQLVNVARKFGFSNVHDYLVHQKTKESPEDIAARKKGRKWSRDSGARFRKSVLKNTVKEEEEEDDGKENEVVEEAELYCARSKVVTSSDDEEEEEEAEEAELSSAHVTSSDDEEEGKNEGVVYCARSKVKAERVNIYEESRKRKTSDGSRMEKISADPRTSSSDRAFDISGSKSRKTDSPAQTCISEDPSDDIWLSQSSCETVSRANSNTEGSDFAKELESALRRPFSTHQFKEMWEHVNYRKCVMKLRQTRSRSIEVPGSADGLSYLDHYPDLAEKLGKSPSPEEKLRLLRGFFFWIQRSCSEGAYRPWRDSPVVDDSGDCTEISGPDCEIIRVLLAIDEDEDKESPEWEDKKPVIKLAEERKKFLSEMQPVPRFPVKVKVEEEEED